jgi:hypothetical protein
MKELSTARPFVFTVIEDDGMNVTVEISGRYKMNRGGLLARHPQLKLQKQNRV